MIALGVGLEHADRVDRENGVERGFEPGALDKRFEHPGRAVGEDGGSEPGLAQGRKDRGNFGKRLEAEIELHQALAQGGRLEIEAFEGEIERVARHLPEVGVAVLERAQPCVLELLVAPEGGQLGALAPSGTSGQRAAAEAKSNSVP